MPPIEEDLKRADELAQEAVNTWGAQMMPPDFSSIFDKACRYLDAKKLAELYRLRNGLIDEVAQAEEIARREFVEAYRAWRETQRGVVS
jgi:hypothetical protein